MRTLFQIMQLVKGQPGFRIHFFWPLGFVSGFTAVRVTYAFLHSLKELLPSGSFESHKRPSRWMFWVFLFPFLFSLCFPASSPSSLPFSLSLPTPLSNPPTPLPKKMTVNLKKEQTLCGLTGDW